MKKKYSSPCIRCGKERVVSKIWEEKLGNSIIINTQTVCPDPECQKKVNNDNKKVHDKYVAMRLKSEERMQNRKAMKRAEKEEKKLALK